MTERAEWSRVVAAAPEPAPLQAPVVRLPEQAGAPVLPLRPRSPGRYERYAKRGLDIVVAALALVMLLPVLLLISAAVLATIGRPVLFRQERVGRDGRHFQVYKFRTMGRDRRQRAADRQWQGPDRRRTHKSEHDPRHTRFGRLLRRSSLDELPQLWNVLRGDMSIVGPRPELVEVVARYSPWQHHRHVVRPGLTGLWQVSARGGAPMHEVTHIDLQYVESVSLRNDLRILLNTPGVLVRRSGS